MATTSNGLVYPANLLVANNPPADFLALANSIDAQYGKTVANIAALPASGVFAGQEVYVTDRKDHAVWNGASWDFKPSGLVPIAAPTVAVSGGSAVANALGTITLTSATSVSFNGVFSSLYKNYRVVFEQSGTSTVAGGGFDFRLRSAGVDANAANYNWGGNMMRNSGTNVSYIGNSTLSGRIAYLSNAPGAGLTLDLFNPFAATATAWVLSAYGADATSPVGIAAAGGHNLASSYDGITFYPSSGAVSGSITIYGYNS